MQILERGRYRARFAGNQADITASQALREKAFDGAIKGLEADTFDTRCDHVLVEETSSGKLVASYRLMQISGRDICKSYSAQYYDLSALQGFQGPFLELGRFCIHPDHNDPEILRVAWAMMTRVVDGQGITMLFGCSSFAGCDATRHKDAFSMLKARHLAPDQWRPLVKSAEVVGFEDVPVSSKALRSLPSLLRTYLAMGGWVSDHAVVDREMNTLHVFVGVEIAAIPEARKRLLRAVAG
ncbi:GNAT family N-acetyltransferase [Profundibacter sp.]